jgi:uncharacterized RDD family membrane protein YckC
MENHYLHPTKTLSPMEENYSGPQEEQHLFDNFETSTLTQAGSGKRLANYFIDFVSFLVFMYFFSYVIVEVSMDLAIIMYAEPEYGGSPLLAQLINMVFYGLYMGLLETVFRGRSFGKFITGTIAVNEDGSRISGKTALLRGLSRAVPFNALSGLGTPCHPWHDRWNDTYVVGYADFAARQ